MTEGVSVGGAIFGFFGSGRVLTWEDMALLMATMEDTERCGNNEKVHGMEEEREESHVTYLGANFRSFSGEGDHGRNGEGSAESGGESL